MAKKTAQSKIVFDKQGFILPLAIGALILMFFAWYFTRMYLQKQVVSENTIQSTSDLDEVSKDLDAQNPDAFDVDLKANTTDAANF